MSKKKISARSAHQSKKHKIITMVRILRAQRASHKKIKKNLYKKIKNVVKKKIKKIKKNNYLKKLCKIIM